MNKKKHEIEETHMSLFLCLSGFHWGDIVKKVLPKAGARKKEKKGMAIRGLSIKRRRGDSNLLHTLSHSLLKQKVLDVLNVNSGK